MTVVDADDGPRGGLAVIVSPRSRYFRKDPEAADRLERAASGSMVARCLDEESTEASLVAIHAAGVGVIAIAGGDGTAGHIIGQAKQLWGDAPLPRFALLRGGTMNTVANGLGSSRGTPEALLKSLVEKLGRAKTHGHAFEVISRPTIDVAGRLGFLFGTGVFQSFLRAYYDKGKQDPTVVTAAQTIGHIVGSILVRGSFAKGITKMDHLQLETDGELWPETRFLTIAAGTVAEVGLGFKPFHLASKYEGAFHLIGVTATASRVVLDLPRVWTGLGVSAKTGRDVVARTARLTPPKGGRIDYMVDGDLLSTDGTLALKTGPLVELIKL